MLKGRALQDGAKELDIPGRSKMSADELRARVAEVERQLEIEQIDLSEPEVPPMVRMAETAKRIAADVAHRVASSESAPQPMGYHDRLAVYCETNNTEHTIARGEPKPTHRQKRRLRKNERKARGL